MTGCLKNLHSTDEYFYFIEDTPSFVTISDGKLTIDQSIISNVKDLCDNGEACIFVKREMITSLMLSDFIVRIIIEWEDHKEYFNDIPLDELVDLHNDAKLTTYAFMTAGKDALDLGDSFMILSARRKVPKLCDHDIIKKLNQAVSHAIIRCHTYSDAKFLIDTTQISSPWINVMPLEDMDEMVTIVDNVQITVQVAVNKQCRKRFLKESLRYSLLTPQLGYID